MRIALDLTQLKKAQQERERLLEQLREAARRKDEFLAVLAHELRNPLAPIRNTLEVLKRAPSDTQLLEQAREMMERQVTHMVRLIDDLLDIGRITHNRMDLRRSLTELQAIVTQAVHTVRPLADAKRQRLDVHLPAHRLVLECDFVRLTQVFVNLLDNACKYAARKARSSSRRRRGGAQVVVTIDDNGGYRHRRAALDIRDVHARRSSRSSASRAGWASAWRSCSASSCCMAARSKQRATVQARDNHHPVRLPCVCRAPAMSWSRRSRRLCRIATCGCWSPTTIVMRPSRCLRCCAWKAMKSSRRSTGATRSRWRRSSCRMPVLMDIGMPVLNGYEVAQMIREQPWGRDMLLIADRLGPE